jgi:hypothetical protein
MRYGASRKDASEANSEQEEAGSEQRAASRKKRTANSEQEEAGGKNEQSAGELSGNSFAPVLWKKIGQARRPAHAGGGGQ